MQPAIIINLISNDYNIINSATQNDLTIQVKNLMSIGWKPLGEVILRFHYNNVFYMQTMIL